MDIVVDSITSLIIFFKDFKLILVHEFDLPKPKCVAKSLDLPKGKAQNIIFSKLIPISFNLLINPKIDSSPQH